MYQEKFFARVAKVEELEGRIDDWETWAKGEVAKDHPEINNLEDPRARANTRASLVRKLLETQPRYKNMVGSRSSNLSMAQMYGFAALLEEIHEDDSDAARSPYPTAGNGDHGPGSTGRGQHTNQAA